MTQQELLQLDETALCLFRRLHSLYEDAHAWFQDAYRAHNIQGNDKFLRLQDISNERDQVSLDLCEHIAYVLLSDTVRRTGLPGIKMQEALFIKLCVNKINLQTSFEEARDELHETLRTLEIIT